MMASDARRGRSCKGISMGKSTCDDRVQWASLWIPCCVFREQKAKEPIFVDVNGPPRAA